MKTVHIARIEVATITHREAEDSYTARTDDKQPITFLVNDKNFSVGDVVILYYDAAGRLVHCDLQLKGPKGRGTPP